MKSITQKQFFFIKGGNSDDESLKNLNQLAEISKSCSGASNWRKCVNNLIASKSSLSMDFPVE